MDEKKIEELQKKAIKLFDSEEKTTAVQKEKQDRPQWLNEVFSAEELEEADIPPTQWIVTNLLPIGLNILASPPKFGKSWMVLDLCIRTAQGLSFMGWSTTQCDVLYLALEDNRGRLQKRQRTLLNGGKVPKNCHFLLTSPAMGEQFTEAMEEYVKAYPQTRLIVVDTFSKIRGERGRTESEYQYDYREAGALKRFADAHNLAILLVHHLRKMEDSTDPFNRISGSTGLFGAVDTAIVMTKEHRSDNRALFSATGRDIEGVECYIEQDEKTKRWSRIGTKEDVEEQEKANKYQYSMPVIAIKTLATSEWWTGTTKKLLSDYSEVAGPNAIEHSFTAKEVGPWITELRKRDGIEVIKGACKDLGFNGKVDGSTRISFRKIA